VQREPAADEIGGEAVMVLEPVQMGDCLGPFGRGLRDDLPVVLVKRDDASSPQREYES